ncbi:hypothetical protein M0R45_026633 [Rubus argutus]|uniref:Uncharacterized protein n=1 Tax=Rubus argutus TaxID=59490 RepID=A0AAW1WZW3_RUBAR
MSVFNDFISEANLRNPPLLNAKFTWSNMRDAAIGQISLLCNIGGILKWGPEPFRVENMWLKNPSFKENFTGWWETDLGPSWERFKFMNKLRGVKTNIKMWSKEVFGDVLMEKKSVEMKIKEQDNMDEREGLNTELKRERESQK